MRFGATIYTLSAKGKFREFVQQLYDLGFRIFELYLPFYRVINTDSSINQTSAKELKDVLSTFEMAELSAHGYYDNEVGVMSNIASVDETTRRMAEKTLKSTIELCSRLNIHILNEHPGTVFPELKRSNRINISLMARDLERLGKAKATSMAIRTLRNCLKTAEENNVMICVENEVPRLDTLPIADNPIVIPTLVEALNDDSLHATCDVGHLALAASFFGFDLILAIKMMKPYLRHLHLHDNKLLPFPVGGRSKQAGLGDLHLPPGQGSIDFSTVMKTLSGTNAIYNLEVLEYKNLSDFRTAAQFLEKEEKA